jgi:hypothetical protein
LITGYLDMKGLEVLKTDQGNDPGIQVILISEQE